MMVRNQTIFRVKKTRDFVMISRITLEDARLSWDARGLHAFLLAKPDDWETCIQHLIQCSPAGRDRVQRILQELIRFHYIIKIEQPRTEKGQYARPQYLVHESPQDGHFDQFLSTVTEKPSTVNPSTDNPLTGNPPLLLKIQTNKEPQNNKKTTTTNDLTWPENLDPSCHSPILTLSKNTSSVVVQLLLDELAGQLDNVKNPVGYFHTLLRNYHSGQFVPAQAIVTRSSRKAKTNNKKAVEESKRQSKEKLLRLVEEQFGNAKE